MKKLKLSFKRKEQFGLVIDPAVKAWLKAESLKNPRMSMSGIIELAILERANKNTKEECDGTGIN